jgi:hypothetical protein
MGTGYGPQQTYAVRTSSSAGRAPPLQQMTSGMPPRELSTPAVAGAQMLSRSGQAYTMAQHNPSHHPAGTNRQQGGGSAGPGSTGEGRSRGAMPGPVPGGGGGSGGGMGAVSGGFSSRA